MDECATQGLKVPDRDAIAQMPPFARLRVDQISVVDSAVSAAQAHADLSIVRLLGFDTESKPTFKVGEISTGPHVLQLATATHAWLFLLHDEAARAQAAALLMAPHMIKAGFGLRDDKKLIKRKLGIEPQGIVDLNQPLRAQGYRKELGVKAAVAVLFGQRFIKNKKIATSNWAQPRLTDAQMIYAANDAYAALRVADVLRIV